MANTYSQIHLQFVFAVKYRQALIEPAWKCRLHEYITGICRSHHHKMLQINSVADHMHILVGMRPDVSAATLVNKIKTSSTRWINLNHFCKVKFAWQEGYGTFSYSYSDIHHVIRYIQNQEILHRKATFLSEYKQFLMKLEIDWKEEYIFRELE
jgi:REP element-mobilizing transposase RayT